MQRANKTEVTALLRSYREFNHSGRNSKEQIGRQIHCSVNPAGFSERQGAKPQRISFARVALRPGVFAPLR
jgi:hypothetical protein